MYQGYGGDTQFAQPLLYDEIVTGKKVQRNYKNNQPDLVVIELGSNDLTATLDSVGFVQAYFQFEIVSSCRYDPWQICISLKKGPVSNKYLH